MILFIQIPCFNEEETLKKTLNDLPKKINGISQIKTLVIDDGSTDETIEVAISAGVDFVISNRTNKGLSKTFSKGIEYCLLLGADIIVNTDGDNQYKGENIEKLIKPILEKKADMVVGVRDITNLKHFSKVKKNLQKFGSYFVNKISRLNIPDVTSGFRAYSRSVAMEIIVLSSFTYTLETLLLAGRRGISLEYVDIEVNNPTRPSRLFRTNIEYVFKSAFDLLFISTQLRPLLTFGLLGCISFFIGVLLGLRYLILLYVLETLPPGAYIQSLVLASILLIFGSLSILIGIVSNMISSNRQAIEEIRKNVNLLKITNEEIKSELSDLIYKKN